MADADFARVLVSNTITRPANTTAYTSGDIVANDTTAASVTPFSFDAASIVPSSNIVRVDRIRLYKSGTSTTNASFRVHLYRSAPASIANGDNGAWSTSFAGYVGAFDVTCDRAFTDGAEGAGVPLTGSAVLCALPAGVTTLYALVEARAGYTPTSGETFTLRAEAYRF